MFQSPLKTVVEKLKPTESKTSLSSLRFERSSDFKKFIKFIKTETEELEKIKLPTTTEIKPKTGTPGLLGLGALGLFGLLGSAFGGGENEENLRLGSAGQASPIKSNLFISKNVRKVSKNIGSSKFIGTQTRFKKTESLFKKKLKGVNIKGIELKLKKLKDLLEEAKERKANNIKTGNASMVFLDDVLIKNLKDQIKTVKNDIKFFKKNKFIRKGSTFDFENLQAFKDLIDESRIKGDEGKKAKAILDKRISVDPEFKDLIKEIDKLDPMLFDVPEGSTLASKVFGRKSGIKIENTMFRTRDFLDEIFTGVGKTTKPLRNFFSPMVKNIAKTKIPFIPGKLSILKGIKGVKTGLPFIDAINAGFMFNQLGFVDFSDSLLKPKIGRNNVITGLYDVFTHFYNAGVEGLGFGDANKRLLIGKPKDEFVTGTTIGGSYRRNLRREKDAYNKKILDARRMRDLFNRSLGDQMNGQQMELLKSVPFASSTSDGAEFSIPPDPLNSGSFDYNLPIYSKLFVQ